MNPRFGFVRLPDRYCTGSSIMPQKKNPDVPELVRGKSGRVFGHLVALLALMKGQPLAYNKDNQEDKEPLFDAVDTVKDCLAVIRRPGRRARAGAGARCAPRRSKATPPRPTSPTTWCARASPFRDAHEVVARAVREAETAGVDLAGAAARQTEELFQAHRRRREEASLTLEGSVAARRPHRRHRAGGRCAQAIARARKRLAQTDRARRAARGRSASTPVVRKLGEGATSEVYLCHDPFSTRDVAVKRRLPRGASATRSAASSTASCSSPRPRSPASCSTRTSAQIYDAVADETLHYIVMEYVDGGTLERFCQPREPARRSSRSSRSSSSARARSSSRTSSASRTATSSRPTSSLRERDRREDHRLRHRADRLRRPPPRSTRGRLAGLHVARAGAGTAARPPHRHLLDRRGDVPPARPAACRSRRRTTSASSTRSPTSSRSRPRRCRPEMPPRVDAIVLRAMAKDREHRYRSWEEFSMRAGRRLPRRAGERAQGAGVQRFRPASRRCASCRSSPDFSDAELWEVARIAAWRNAAPGERLMTEGEPGDFFCILAQGAGQGDEERPAAQRAAGPESRSARWRTSQARRRCAAPTSRSTSDANIISVPSAQARAGDRRLPPQVRPRLHADPGRAAVGRQPQAVGRLGWTPSPTTRSSASSAKARPPRCSSARTRSATARSR